MESARSIDEINLIFRVSIFDEALNAKLMDPSISADAKIYLLVNEAKSDHSMELPALIMAAQDVLVESGILPESRHFVYQPPPEKLHLHINSGDSLSRHKELTDFLRSQCQQLSMFNKETEPCELTPGLLVLALVLECGILSKAELSSALTSAAELGLRKMGELNYLQVPSKIEGGKLMDSRRVYLSPLTTVLLLRMSRSSLLALALFINKSLKALSNLLGWRLSIYQITSAMSAHAEHYHRIPLWLLSWMRHDGIYSSSITEDCWLRLNRYHTNEINSEIDLSQSDDFRDDNPSNPASPIADDPLFGKIGHILRYESNDTALTKISILRLEPEFRQLAIRYPAAGQLFQWLIALHDQYNKTSTIRLNFQAVAHRLLALCGETPLHELTQDDFHYLLEQLQEDGLASSTQSNVASALNNLIRFLNRAFGTSFSPLPTGLAISIANARVMSPPDIRSCLDYLSSARCRLAPNYRQPAQDLIYIAFQTGLRRQEALHLDGSRIVGMPSILQVRNTKANKLKSNASSRDIPLDLLHRHNDTLDYTFAPPKDGLLIQPKQTMKSLPLEPGSPNHLKSGDMLINEVHRTFRAITGDSQLTMHSLRHSCATTLLLLLLARRFRLHELTELIPYLADILDPDSEQLARKWLCPGPYENDGELASIRDLLGHSSEKMTLAHYVHVLDILRLAIIRRDWLADKKEIARAAGFSDYMLTKHPLSTLLNKLIASTDIEVTVFEPDDRPRYSIEADQASQMVREMTAVSLRAKGPEDLCNLLSLAGKPSRSLDSARTYIKRRELIEPMAIAFLSNKSTATTLRDLIPVSSWRDEAIWLCDNIISMWSIFDRDERNYHYQILSEDIYRLLSNVVQISSSTIRIVNRADLMSFERVCSGLLNVTLNDQEFFIWRKKGKSHIRENVAASKVIESLMNNDISIPGLFARVVVMKPNSLTTRNDVDRQLLERSYLSTLSWVFGCFYILFS